MIRLTDRSKAFLAILSIFVTGVAVGCGLDRTILAPPADAAVPAARLGEPRHHEEVLTELRAELGLSAGQSASVEKIFAAHQEALAQVREGLYAKLRQAMQEGRRPRSRACWTPRRSSACTRGSRSGTAQPPTTCQDGRIEA